jgi:hypothetical protein
MLTSIIGLTEPQEIVESPKVYQDVRNDPLNGVGQLIIIKRVK